MMSDANRACITDLQTGLVYFNVCIKVHNVTGKFYGFGFPQIVTLIITMQLQVPNTAIVDTIDDEN